MTFIKTLSALAAAGLIACAVPAFATTPDSQKELEQARKELDQARDELRRAAAEMARVTREHNAESPRARVFEFMADPDRAVLGVSIATGPEKDGTLSGVLVTAVTPGSGADQAGIKSGDVLLSANGKSLAAKKGERSPNAKLLDIMRELKSGDHVALEYARDGKTYSATVTAGRAPESMIGAVPPVPALPPIPPIPDVGSFLDFENDDDHDILLPPGMGNAHVRIFGDDAWDLAALDGDLASYFKTDKGVLVIHPPKDSKLGLKGGDVVQKVNGEAVSTPSAFRSSLRHLSGKEVALDVVRHGKNETVKGKLEKSGRTRTFRKRIEIEDGHHGEDDDAS